MAAEKKKTRKQATIPPIRVEPAMKRFFKQAAEFDNRTLTGFLIHAAQEYSRTLEGRGWKFKNLPAFVDYRKAA